MYIHFVSPFLLLFMLTCGDYASAKLGDQRGLNQNKHKHNHKKETSHSPNAEHEEKPEEKTEEKTDKDSDSKEKNEEPVEKTEETKDDCQQLRMYWEEGYNWQTEEEERWWCMSLDDEHFKYLRITNCRTDSTKQKWTLEDGNLKSCRENKCATLKDKTTSDHDGWFAELTDCSDETKVWGTNGDSDKFELQAKNQCATTDHWPRWHESVILNECDQAKKHETNLWTWTDVDWPNDSLEEFSAAYKASFEQKNDST